MAGGRYEERRRTTGKGKVNGNEKAKKTAKKKKERNRNGGREREEEGEFGSRDGKRGGLWRKKDWNVINLGS